MQVFRLDPRYIAKAKPVCLMCTRTAAWRGFASEDLIDAGVYEQYCDTHVPMLVTALDETSG